MHVDTFARVSATGLSLQKSAELYARWVLGLDTPHVRARRLGEGVRRSWELEDVVACEPLVGDHGCRIDMRVGSDSVIVRFVHRDDRDGAVLWTTVARAREVDGRVIVEHALGREVPRGYEPVPIAAAPRVLTALFETAGVAVTPRELHAPLVTLGAADTKGWVDHELIRPDREAVIAVVSCARGGDPPVVDERRLATRLRGLATVVFLSNDASTFAFGDALARHGFGPEYRCFHAGVHLYGPARDLVRDHRLWLGDTLREIPDRERTDRVAGLIARRIAVRNTPPGFFGLVEEHDREERRRLAERLVTRKASTAPPPIAGPSTTYVDELSAERDQLRRELQATVAREREYSEAWLASDERRRIAEEERDDAEARLEQERAISTELRDQLARNKSEVRTSLAPDVARALGDVMSGEQTPEDCLRLLAFTFPERVVVLESAYGSARKSRDFKHTGKLAALFRKLATTYYDALAAGKGDVEAAEVLGDAFSAKESKGTMSNRRALEERTFRYGARDLVMWPHLRIGVKESTAETIRVHFEWVAVEKRLVVGWCGEHRYRVG